MLCFLLDEHISPAVAEGLRRRYKSLPVTSLVEWEGGRFLGLSDDVILGEASVQKLTLVAYDRRTIPPLLKNWAESARSHGGVVFVDEKSIPPSDFGGLVRALKKLFDAARDWEWANRVCFLRR